MDRIFKCSQCQRGFKTKSNLQNHAKICTGNINEIDCESCGKLFKTKKTLKQHQNKCNFDKKYQCPECSHQFELYTSYLSHKNKFHRKVECSICMQEIHYKNKQRHLKTVHARDAPASFAARMKIENETKPFKCDVCDKKFKHKQSLNKHKRSHKNVVTYCDACEEKCDSNVKRRYHKESIHNQVNLDFNGLGEITQLRKLLEQLMYFFKNRGQEKTLEEIKTILTNIKK